MWQYSGGMHDPWDAHRLANENTLITDIYNGRVIEVTPSGAIAWSMSGLYEPTYATRLDNGNTLISDGWNRRAIEVNPSYTTVWQSGGLYHAQGSQRLSNGNTLIADDYGGCRVVEVDPSGTIVWQYGTPGETGGGPNKLYAPRVATRMNNGNTLIADIAGHRVLEVDVNKNVVWQYGITATPGTSPGYLNSPMVAQRIGDVGRTLSAPTVTSITPDSGLNNGMVNITNLAGSNFLAGATVKLTKSGQSDIAGTSVTVVSGTKITCTFDLTGKAAGTWTVVVTNPDAQSGSLTDGFTVLDPTPLWSAEPLWRLPPSCPGSWASPWRSSGSALSVGRRRSRV